MLDKLHPLPIVGSANERHQVRVSEADLLGVEQDDPAERGNPKTDLVLGIQLRLELLDVAP